MTNSEKLCDLLLRIISTTYGIEDEQSFLESVLSQIHQYFGPLSTRLFVKGTYGEGYEQIACHPAPLSPEEISPSFEAQELDDCTPVLSETAGGMHLLLPLCHEKYPSMLLSLSWKDVPPPGWIRGDKLLMGFQRELGNYLPWKHVMLKIAAAKNHLQVIFDHLPDAVSVINSDYTIERVNKAFTRLFDIPFSEAIGKKCYQVVHHGVAPDESCLMERTLEGREEMSVETGSGKRLQVTFLPLIGENNEPKSLQFFELKEDVGLSRKGAQNYDFFQLYNLLSQPMTVLSLLSAVMVSKPNETPESDYLNIIRAEIFTIINILREAHLAASALQKKTVCA